jgi:two-component system chemotaxis response regulator CheB
MTRRIRVLIVDDSASFRTALAIAIASDPDVEVVGQAANGNEALTMARRLQPDVITLDAIMPSLDGPEVARRLLAERQVAIILMSALARSDEQRGALNALRLGVVDIVDKPTLVGPKAARSIAAVLRLIKAASEIVFTPRAARKPSAAAALARSFEVVAMAASTGGPPALERVLMLLPQRFPPLIVAQHLAPSFARSFAQWLASASGRQVISVTDRLPLARSTVYVAAETRHLRLTEGAVEGVAATENEVAPNADVLFQSAATAYGARALGVVLTGMGSDGAVGLLAMRQKGAWTIGQDVRTSTVFGMPRAAEERGACCEMLPLDDIAGRIAAAGAAP